MRARRCLTSVGVLILACGVAPADEVAFSAVPKISEKGGSVSFTFGVTEYTDVTVEVVDSAGKRICALAAGKLGPNPPIPLAWPLFVTNVNNSVYVSDPGGHRVLKVRLGYAKQWDSDLGILPPTFGNVKRD